MHIVKKDVRHPSKSILIPKYHVRLLRWNSGGRQE